MTKKGGTGPLSRTLKRGASVSLSAAEVRRLDAILADLRGGRDLKHHAHSEETWSLAGKAKRMAKTAATRREKRKAVRP